MQTIQVGAFDTLLVLIPDRLSELIRKGEITDRYYNPGNLFKCVHIVCTNDDLPDKALLQRTVGAAKLVLHNFPAPSFVKTFGWHPSRLNSWANLFIEKVRSIGPQLVRCHGNQVNTFLAHAIKRELGISYVVSLHTNMDDNRSYHVWREHDFKHLIFYTLLKPLERVGLKDADAVICVYEFIRPYAERRNQNRVEVIYNTVNPSNLKTKLNYQTSDPLKAVIVGRQFAGKDPAPLIKALKELPNVVLTLIGDGPIHESLKRLSIRCGVQSRCRFIPSLPNDTLSQTLKDFDIFISINDYGGISKAELEAALVGIPIITNSHPLEEVPEVLGKNCLVVSGTPESYVHAILSLAKDEEFRRNLGQRLRKSVGAINPSITEQKVVELYREILAGTQFPIDSIRRHQ